jgi:type II secretory pathway pseudopilin PulG
MPLQAAAQAGRRAFTLIEAMLALVLMMCLAGLTVWSFSAALSQRGVSEAGSRIEAAVSMGRAEAQRRGEALELVAVSGQGGGRLVVRPLAQTPSQAERSSSEAASGASRQASESGGWTRQTNQPADEAGVQRASRSSEMARLPERVIVESVRAGGEQASPEGQRGELSAGQATTNNDVPSTRQEEVVLAILWPTGHTTQRGQAVVRGPSGELRSILIDQWTGVCRVEAMVAPQPSEEDEFEGSWSEPVTGPGTTGRAGSRIK